MDKKRVSNFRVRIKRAESNLNCMGDMILIYEFKSMSLYDLETLRDSLLKSRSPLRYETLDKIIEEKINNG